MVFLVVSQSTSETVDVTSEFSVELRPSEVLGSLFGFVFQEFLFGGSDGFGSFGTNSFDLSLSGGQFSSDGSEFLSSFLSKGGVVGSHFINFSVKSGDFFSMFSLGLGEFTSPVRRDKFEDLNGGFPPVQEVVLVSEVTGETTRRSPASSGDATASPGLTTPRGHAGNGEEKSD
jgi:hypothetical protein